jgi:hypothetical protein
MHYADAVCWHRYAGSVAVMACLAAAVAFRGVRLAVSAANLPEGDSRIELISSDGIAMGATLWPVVCLGIAIAVFAVLGV